MIDRKEANSKKNRRKSSEKVVATGNQTKFQTTGNMNLKYLIQIQIKRLLLSDVIHLS